MTGARICSYGVDAVYIDLDLDGASDRAKRTHALARVLRNRFPEADIVVGGGVLVAVGNLRVADVVAAVAEPLANESASHSSPRTHIIPVVFDGPDLDDVSHTLGRTPHEIVQCLAANDLAVELIGFLPGFGYLGPLDRRLVLPRRKAPRPRVPAGSLAIAGAFAGIYPFASPGGWHLLGRAAGVILFDPDRERPFLFSPGDHVRFEAIAATDVPPTDKAAGKNVFVDKPAFIVELAPACATIQDVGRLGRLHDGMPPSGPLDPDTFIAANLAVGNDSGEAAIEIPLGRLVVRAMRDIVVSLDGDKPVQLFDGDRFEIKENDCAVRYLAFRGGVDVPLVLGSRATLIVARVGGFSGRPLRKGDMLGVADRVVRELRELPSTSFVRNENADVVKIVIDPGPHLDRFPPNALDVFLASTYCISTLGDRVGVRLDGEKIPRHGSDSALPVPMIRGAVQIATDGTPIVFGPDHPTTGGYPVLAVVRRVSWGDLARQRAGKPVRFVRGA